MAKSQYEQLGVDVKKKGIEKFTAVDKELYPNAFCKMYETGNRIVCQHMDGVGSKSVQRYLHFKETDDYSVFEGDAQDCLEMNLGDILCCGLNPTEFTDYLAINGKVVPKENYIQALNKGFEKSLTLLRKYGVNFIFCGGETADLPDQERTYDFAGTIRAEAKKRDVITGNKIVPGDAIIGIRSGGKANFEEKINSGIMSNGLTLARHALMHRSYDRKYPETHDPSNKNYGRFMTTDSTKELGTTVGEAIMSPTRHFSIIIKSLVDKFGTDLHGIVMNTGGGQTKCKRIGRRILYNLYNLPTPDPIFRLIQSESGEKWENMYKTFNMGIGVSLMVPKDIETEVIKYVNDNFMKCGAMMIGATEKSTDKNGKNIVHVVSENGTFDYSA